MVTIRSVESNERLNYTVSRFTLARRYTQRQYPISRKSSMSLTWSPHSVFLSSSRDTLLDPWFVMQTALASEQESDFESLITAPFATTGAPFHRAESSLHHHPRTLRYHPNPNSAIHKHRWSSRSSFHRWLPGQSCISYRRRQCG